MYHLMYWSSYLISLIISKNTVVKTQFVDVPLPMVETLRNHIDKLSSLTATPHWKDGDTVEQVAYRQGQADVVRLARKIFLGG